MAGVVVLAGAAAVHRAPSVLADPTDSAEPDRQIEDRLGALERTYNAIIGTHCVGFDTGRNINYRDAELFAVCSTFKAYAAASVLQKAQRSQLRLDEVVSGRAPAERQHRRKPIAASHRRPTRHRGFRPPGRGRRDTAGPLGDRPQLGPTRRST
jgi:beta-lactamase class A